MHKSKRMKSIYEKIDIAKTYTIEQAVQTLRDCPKVKFDETIDVSIHLGVDSKKSDQQVRGTVSLPHGTGKNVRVVVVAKGEKLQDAKDAGAFQAGSDDIIEKIKGGWTDFDVLVCTPDLMREVGKLGKVLGPRGLMPTPKAGTVTNDVAKAVAEHKTGMIEYKVDKSGVVNNGVGKVSFPANKLVENIQTYIAAVNRSKPSTSKGQYLKSMHLSTTMGPGLKVDLSGMV